MTHISLALVGLMWVVPFLLTTHEYPLTTFDQEWWVALIGVFALSALVSKSFWEGPTIPRISILPVGLVLIALMQVSLGMIPFLEQGLLYIEYLLFAALLIVLGGWLRRAIGLENIALVLAVFLLIGAELSAFIGVLQHFGWHTVFDSVVVRKVSFSLYGNVAQPNHYANYITLGLISVGLLYQRNLIKLPYLALILTPLLFVLTLSGSRSSLLYLLGVSLLAFWLVIKNRQMKKIAYFMLAVLIGSALMHLLVLLPFLAGSGDETNAWSRLINSDTSGSIRIYLWHEAILMFMQQPFLGVGFGQFAWNHSEWLPILKPNSISGLYNNAHNVVLQLAAETGLLGLLVLLGGAGAWAWGLRRVSVFGSAHWWGYSIILVLCIHGSLEYPLWYLYFISILALLLGIFDETAYRLELRNLGRVSIALILSMALISIVQMQITYRELKAALSIQSISGVSQENSMRTYQSLYLLRNGALLSPYANLYLASYIDVSPQNLEQKVALNYKVVRFIPTSDAMYRQSFLLAQGGKLGEAEKVMEQAIWSYPGNGSAHQILLELNRKDPAHFSALLEFATQKEQEHARAVRIR